MNPHLGLSDYYLEVARGYVPNAITVHKFGEGDGIDTADGIVDIWDGTSDLVASPIKTYTWSTTADIDTISSSNDSDTMDVEIQGLDENWDLVLQTVTVDGQTKVTLPTPLIRVFRMKNVGTTNILGNLFCYVDTAIVGGIPTDGSKVRAIIRDGHNQTQMALYSVPRGYSLFIKLGWSTIAGKNTTANIGIFIKVRSFGSVFRELHTTALLSAGNSVSTRPYEIPLKLEEKTDIIYSCGVTQNDTAVSSGFHGILIPDGSR